MNILRISIARKNLITSIEFDFKKDSKLNTDLELPFNRLIEEALRDLLNKYDNKSK